jgi:A/G-specific adenine glycosylase
MKTAPAKLRIQADARDFRARLLCWYDVHARDLPWRRDRDPYRVWLSEIMLQQTRVAAVIEHYHEFLRRFPTVEKLAAARQPSVLAAWSGLGYYRRARMLHAAAKVVSRESGRRFPTTAAGLLSLPGVGRYTAAAIASIAFGEAVAVVDGNVERVLQRISGQRLYGEKLWEAAEELLDRERPGDFNQAMMELGATVCTPRIPSCLTCPVVELCATRGELADRPKPLPQEKREVHYALHFRDADGSNGKVLLVQRARDASLMAGMWELPEIEVGTGEKHVPRFARNDKSKRSHHKNNGRATPIFMVRHSITVTDYAVWVWRGETPRAISGQWILVERLNRLPLTGLARKILRKAEVLQD